MQHSAASVRLARPSYLNLVPVDPVAVESVSQADFRQAMSLLGAPVVVVTTDGPAGRHGLTVSAITSVSDTPPSVLICLNRDNRSYSAFLDNARVGISILAHDQDATALKFASSKLDAEAKFAGHDWIASEDGAPLLSGALVGLDCTIAQVHQSGTHDVLFLNVRAITHGATDGHGLAYFSRRFHPLARSVEG